MTTDPTPVRPGEPADADARLDASPAAVASPAAPAGAAKLATLAACRRFFFSKASPKIMIGALALVVALRVRQGGFSWWDLVVLVAILGFEPFTEWLVHVYILHWRPRTVGGVRLDIHAARKHRAHHLDPNDPHTSFIPLVDLVVLVGLAFALFFAIVRGDLGLWLTAMAVSLGMLLTYEWTHFLIHTPYRPQGRYYRSIWRAHRLHHFKNEHYWMGVTVNLADHVLGTFPAKSEVENSPTARTLGIDVA